MSNGLGVGLHIIYGRMGAGKSNYAVSQIITSTTYKKCICNIPLYPEFTSTLDIEFETYKKLEPEKVIRQIDEIHQDTLFIVDEAQMVLLSANSLLVNSFVKKMSQIRQNNQCVVVIAQVSKMLPAAIKDLAEDCYFFENNNVKGVEKSSKVKQYRSGYDYTSRLISTFNYTHVYGLYESTNTPTTEKPKNLYKRTYIKIVVTFAIALVLFIFVGWKFYSFFFGTKEEKQNSSITHKHDVSFLSSKQDDFILEDNCIRSWHHLSNGVVSVMWDSGEIEYLPILDFSKQKKCPLFSKSEVKK